MATYYHVVSNDYQPGDDLLCWDAREARGDTPTWKWEGEPFDTDVVCLFETLDEAENMQSMFGGQILTIIIPDDDDMLSLTRVSEGYPAVYTKISSAYIKA